MRHLMHGILRRRKALVLLLLFALGAWGGKALYDRVTASPARWAQAMADGVAATRAGDPEAALAHYTRAVREARKFGRRDLRLAESLEARAEHRSHYMHYHDHGLPADNLRQGMHDAWQQWKEPRRLMARVDETIERYHVVTAIERDLREALAIREREQGPMHLDLLPVLEMQAKLYEGTGREEQARACLAHGRAMAEANSGQDNPRVADLCEWLARVLWYEDAPASRAYLERAYAIRLRHAAHDGEALVNTALSLSRRLDDAAALALWDKTLATLEAHHGPQAEVLRWPLSYLGRRYKDTGRLDAAEDAYRRAYVIDESHTASPWDHWHRLQSLYSEQGRTADIARLHQETLDSRTARFGAQSMEVASLLGGMSNYYYSIEGDLARATDYAEQRYAILTTLPGVSRKEIGFRYGELLRLYEAQGRTEDAARLKASRP